MPSLVSLLIAFCVWMFSPVPFCQDIEEQVDVVLEKLGPLPYFTEITTDGQLWNLYRKDQRNWVVATRLWVTDEVVAGTPMWKLRARVAIGWVGEYLVDWPHMRTGYHRGR